MKYRAGILIVSVIASSVLSLVGWGQSSTEQGDKSSIAANQSSADAPHIMGVCELVELDDQGNADHSLQNPVTLAEEYFYFTKQPKVVNGTVNGVRVIKKPRHGVVSLWTHDDLYTPREVVKEGFAGANYFAVNGYTGNDSLILEVKGKDYGVQLHYFLRVSWRVPNYDEMFMNRDCKGTTWIISATLRQQPYAISDGALTGRFREG
ncbi:MAG: hypothetical protein ABUS47_09950 [Steroidobacter sp.]